MNEVLLNIGSYQITIGQAILVLIILAVWSLMYFKGKNFFFQLLGLSDTRISQRIRKMTLITMHMLFAISLVYILDLNYSLISSNGFDFDVINVLISVLILQITRYLDLLGLDVIAQSEESFPLSRGAKKQKRLSGSRSVHFILICLALLLLIGYFGIDRAFKIPVGDGVLVIHLSNVLLAILAILFARLVYWFVTSVLLQGWYHTKGVDPGVRFAFNQLIGYVIFTIGFLFAFQNLGINMSVLWASGAALLVGIGLGLQQTFADFFAGVVLLFERSVKVGDVLETKNDRGVVTKIGLRTSVIMTPSDERIVIPNSQLTNEQVVNWSSGKKGLRYDVQVDVAYGTDIDKVEIILLDVISEIKNIQARPKPFVRFNNFGDSGLAFGIYFYSKQHMQIEDVKSDLRKKIYNAFAQHNVTIPFPQRDVWIKKE